LCGERAGGRFIASWLRGGRVAAGMNVNVWDMNEHVQALARSSRAAEAAALADPAPRLAHWPARLRGES